MSSSAHTVAVANPMLPGAGLGDDPPLAHALGEQHLAQRVVELVRARVVEILALQIDGPAEPLRQPPRPIERRGTSAEIAQQPIELGSVVSVLPCVGPCLLELSQARA